MISIQGTLRLQLRIKINILEIASLWAMFSQQSGDNLLTTSEREREQQIDSEQQDKILAKIL